jgi:hypothetical protein
MGEVGHSPHYLLVYILYVGAGGMLWNIVAQRAIIWNSLISIIMVNRTTYHCFLSHQSLLCLFGVARND